MSVTALLRQWRYN